MQVAGLDEQAIRAVPAPGLQGAAFHDGIGHPAGAGRWIEERHPRAGGGDPVDPVREQGRPGVVAAIDRFR
ncbi:MAG TPA: hypothetical protein VEA41_05915, partial [Salinarimonas sp.]|nr:hypothetical protein [Salinarimonas sp.]